MSFLFEKLDVYQRAVEFADATRRLCYRLPRGNGDIADQLRRASVSIAANIAESNGRWHTADKRQFICIARGSAFECVPLIELLLRNNAVSRDVASSSKDAINTLVQMLNGLLRSLGPKAEKR